MKLFSCDNCQQTLYFENSRCVSCGETVAYRPETAQLATLKPDDRQCRNALEHDACNWLVDRGERGRVLHVLRAVVGHSRISRSPRTNRPGGASRRPSAACSTRCIALRTARSTGLTFRFLKSTEDEPVMTGHDDGVITLNIDEADFAFRENMREKMGEGYRTVLGHLRHEIGHYYWDRLVATTPRCSSRSARCSATSAPSYEEALERHYEYGPPADWTESLHQRLRHACIRGRTGPRPGRTTCTWWTRSRPPRATASRVRAPAADKPGERIATDRLAFFDFEALTTGWNAVTLALNSLNRSMGMKDAYPFVLSPTVLDKLRFVHELVQSQRAVASPVEAAA